MKSVNEVRKLSGVSRRTLQYYDEIGLLPPSRVKESGYRQYDDASLRRLWSILFYKELGLSLGDIRVLLESPKETEKELLRQHKQLLLAKQADLEKLTLSVERILNDEFELSMLRDFDKNRIEAVREKYAQEIGTILESGFVRPLIKNGIIPDDTSFVENAAKIIHIDFDRVIALYIKVIQSFTEAMQYGPDSLEAAEAVGSFVELLGMWIACDDYTLRDVAQAYLDFKEELNEKMPGVAEFVGAAIMHLYR
ncbi:MAG: MerR family transcriptional regulator [Firmicutes bacterium]|nr:MerR family transcriptional regulator [Bacillota bacterium]